MISRMHWKLGGSPLPVAFEPRSHSKNSNWHSMPGSQSVNLDRAHGFFVIRTIYVAGTAPKPSQEYDTSRGVTTFSASSNTVQNDRSAPKDETSKQS